MEQFLVKQVKVNNLKCGDEFCIPSKWTQISIIELIEYMKAKNPNDIVLVKLPSPEILIPSERDIRFKMDGLGWDSYSGSYVTNGIIEIANWALSRLKELNPNVNFRTK